MHIIPLWVDGSEHRIGKSGAPKRSYSNVAFSCKRCAISTRIVAQCSFAPARPEHGWEQGKCQTWNLINAWPVTKHDYFALGGQMGVPCLADA